MLFAALCHFCWLLDQALTGDISVVEYKWTKPPLNEYKQLFEIVGWTSVMTVSDEILQLAIDNSWQWVSVLMTASLLASVA
jgi:hypothetical protein